MKKIISVFITFILCVLSTSCGEVSKADKVKAQFINDFEITSKNIELEEIYNSYKGIPYEGIAEYKVICEDQTYEDMEKWDSLPYSDMVKDYITSTSVYVNFPNITDGTYRFIDRNPGTTEIKNASLCVYDRENGIAYYLIMDT